METLLLPVEPANPAPPVVRRAAVVLRSGGLVAFPTETVYGLGANAFDADAVARIFAAKGRPATNPVIVHVPTAGAARGLVNAWPEVADRLTTRYWPGPLTLVLPRSLAVPDVVTAGGSTVGVRVPAHPVALALLREAGIPVAAPSANRSSRLSPTRAAHVLEDLGGRIDMILDGGPTPGGLESTVLDLTVSPPRLLRPGLVTATEIETLIGPIQRATPADRGVQPLRSPGLLARHYAPRTRLEALEAHAAAPRVSELLGAGLRVGWLSFGTPTQCTDAAPPPAMAAEGHPHSQTGTERLLIESMPTEPTAYAQHLYATLHEMDTLGMDVIIAELPPAEEVWRAARDRLTRATASRG